MNTSTLIKKAQFENGTMFKTGEEILQRSRPVIAGQRRKVEKATEIREKLRTQVKPILRKGGAALGIFRPGGAQFREMAHGRANELLRVRFLGHGHYL